MTRKFWLSLVLLCACGVVAQKNLMKTAVDGDSQRKTTFEAAARMIDEKPEYVEELYALVKKHPATMDRFLACAVRDLEDPAFAKTATEAAVARPLALKVAALAAIDAVKASPEARATLNQIAVERQTVLVDIVTDDRAALEALAKSAIVAVEKKPVARETLLGVIRESAPRLVAIAKDDPKTLRVLVEAFLRAAIADRPALESILKKIGLLK